jgi:hypothetical protein
LPSFSHEPGEKGAAAYRDDAAPVRGIFPVQEKSYYELRSGFTMWLNGCTAFLSLPGYLHGGGL